MIVPPLRLDDPLRFRLRVVTRALPVLLIPVHTLEAARAAWLAVRPGLRAEHVVSATVWDACGEPCAEVSWSGRLWAVSPPGHGSGDSEEIVLKRGRDPAETLG